MVTGVLTLVETLTGLTKGTKLITGSVGPL